ncbi:hypothetical protein RF11_11048 [Thelohanellus kitauei]|uniref:Uncharacterized protein n=1 Tax=Thelohanellus kitauei TaxID=669202 RepID=A0A0C2IVK5_THEKT|nr:hypothetical protein RF11_11048 [Thelohanellus kitauei]
MDDQNIQRRDIFVKKRPERPRTVALDKLPSLLSKSSVSDSSRLCVESSVNKVTIGNELNKQRSRGMSISPLKKSPISPKIFSLSEIFRFKKKPGKNSFILFMLKTYNE